MSSALPLAVPSAAGTSNRTMSPSSFWPASSARVPPICPAPISAIFLRAMRKTPVREGGAWYRDSRGPARTRAGFSDRMLLEVRQQQFRGAGGGLIHDKMPHAGQHFHGIGRADELGSAVGGIRPDG